MALGDSISSAANAYDNFNSQRLPGMTNVGGTAMTNASLTPSGWDAFRSSYDQYANPNLNPHADQTFYVPGVGNIVRGYNDGSGVGQVLGSSAVNAGGEGGGGLNFSDLNQQATDAYGQLTDSQRYSYSTPHDFGALKGHEQSYSYDPATGGVKINGSDYDNSPDWNDRYFSPLIKLALGAAVGAGVAGVASGAAAGAGGGTGTGFGADYLGASAGSTPVSTGVGTLAEGTTAATSAVPSAAPGFLDQAGNYLSQLGTQWGQLNPLLRTGLGTLATSAVKGLSGGGSSDDASSTNPFSSIVQAYAGGNDPSGLAALDSQSVASSGAAPGLFNSYGAAPSYAGGNDPAGLAALDSQSVATSGAAPGLFDTYGSVPNSTPWYQSLLGKAGSNPVTSLANILSGNGQGADYANALTSALGLGASVYNGVAGSNAAKTAAGQQTSAINNANALTAAIYGDTVTRNAPFVQAGTGAVKKMADLNGLNGAVNQGTAAQNFVTSDPGYQFRMDQGNRAVQASAAGQGGLYSGRAFKDAQTYAQNLGAQEYGNAYSRLSGLATLGQNSANTTGLIGANYGNTAAGLTTAGGIAQSAGTMGSTNAITNALSQFLKNQSQNGYYGN